MPSLLAKIRLASPGNAGALRLAREYAVALAFLLLFAVGEVIVDSLPARQRAAALLWASTNVTNLHHHPVPALIVSAFVSQGSLLAWVPLIALAMFGANRAVGNLWLAAICAAGQVIGTLVSEGITGYRVDHHDLPQSWAHIPDVGASYVVVSAIVVAVMFGSRLARIAALLDFVLLVFVGDIFNGLTKLHVAAVGHLTAMVTATILGVALAISQRPSRHPQEAETSVPT